MPKQYPCHGMPNCVWGASCPLAMHVARCLPRRGPQPTMEFQVPDDQASPHASDPVIEAAPLLAGLTISAEQRDGVRLHLQNSLAIAERIGPVGAEAAPTFRP